MVVAVSINRIHSILSIQQVAAIAGIQKNGSEQSKEREFERVFETAKAKERQKEVSTKKSGFGRISCCYGKRAMELGFIEQPIFDELR